MVISGSKIAALTSNKWPNNLKQIEQTFNTQDIPWFTEVVGFIQCTICLQYKSILLRQIKLFLINVEGNIKYHIWIWFTCIIVNDNAVARLEIWSINF